MTSYRETFDRHRRLLCAPVVLAAVLALWFTLGTPKTYESTAALWVDNPAPEPSSLTETNPELRTPAEQQQLLVGELLQTRSFRVAVADRSPLRAYLAAGAPTGWAPTAMLHALGGRPSLDAQILSALGPKHLIAAVQGPQLLTLKYRGPTPTVVAGTLAALIKELTARRVAVDVERGVRTRAFYQAQVDAAQKGVAEAAAAVADYQRANPTAGPGDPNLKAALRAQRVAGQDLAQSTTKLNQARSETQGPDASDTGVDVMDAPRAPDRTRERQGQGGRGADRRALRRRPDRAARPRRADPVAVGPDRPADRDRPEPRRAVLGQRGRRPGGRGPQRPRADPHGAAPEEARRAGVSDRRGPAATTAP